MCSPGQYTVTTPRLYRQTRRKNRMKVPGNRSDVIQYDGMQHAPENELGVVFLFAKVHRRLGFTGIHEIKPGFPDCWAWRRGTKGSRLTWIEFEFRSSSFRTHVNQRQLRGLRPAKGFVVCWEHNWPECEKYAEVIDLRSIAERGPRVWIQSTLPKYQEEMDCVPHSASSGWTWTVAPRAKPGDLVLLWRAGTKYAARKYGVPEDRLQAFTNLVEVVSPPGASRSRFIRSARIRRVANLENPLRWGALTADPILRTAPFVRAQMQGQWDATAYWWRLHSLMVRLNPGLRRNGRFRNFDPRRLW